jgi:hypothetical protein
LAVVAVVSVSACQSPPPPSTPPAPNESSAFTALVDECVDQFAAHHPSIAAGNGLHQADERLERARGCTFAFGPSMSGRRYAIIRCASAWNHDSDDACGGSYVAGVDV